MRLARFNLEVDMITFIIGTDTGVGKTHYGKKLIREGKLVIKPIETGKLSFDNISQSDSYTYGKLQSLDISEINCYFFSQAFSPHLASEIDGVKIDIKKIQDFINSKPNPYVELAGGLMVPLTRDYTQLDLIKSFPKKSINVDLVVGNKLGCINHALLTIELLKGSDINIQNVFINHMGLDKTPMMIDNEKYIKKYITRL